ncbi:MAG: glycosyl hydrolase [Planctomycetota bacterium]
MLAHTALAEQTPWVDETGQPVSVPEVGVVRVEAEHFDNGGPGIAYHEPNPDERPANAGETRPEVSVDLGYAGSGVTIGYVEPGEWWEYTLDVPTAGERELFVSYARGAAEASTLRFTVNGRSTDIVLGPTGGWLSFTIANGVLPLDAGTNVIRVEAVDVGAINLDYFELLAAPTYGNEGKAWVVGDEASVIDGRHFDTTRRLGRDAPPMLSETPLPYTMRLTRSGYHKATFALADVAPDGGTVTAEFNGYTAAVDVPAESDRAEIQLTLRPGLGVLNLTGTDAAIESITIERAITAIESVAVGAGSYAAAPPNVVLDRVSDLFTRVFEKEYDWIDRPADAPLPTNDWWTNILESPFAGWLTPYPLRARTGPDGVTVMAVTDIGGDAGTIAVSGSETIRLMPPNNAAFTRDALLDHSDWTIHFRMESDTKAHVDVTLGRGMPAVWFEASGMPLRFDVGNAVLAEDNGDHIRLTKGTAEFGIFTDDNNAVFVLDGNVLTVVNATAVTVATLPSAEALPVFAEHATARPVGSTFDFDYEPGLVTTTWAIETSNGEAALQTWLPHHVEATIPPAGLTGDTYPSIRGPVALSTGNTFTIAHRAYGMPYVLPKPTGADFDEARMRQYLNEFAAEMVRIDNGPIYVNNTYWGGKDMQRYAEFALMADTLGDDTADEFQAALETSVTDWLTYTPGEQGRFYAAYPGSSAIVGFAPDFGSQNFTDHHFHYGYLTASAGVLMLRDPAFAEDFGEMATLVAKQYANPDREDKRFPYLRTFEPWVGHSYAAGTSSDRGNNQESTSEAIQSWLGLALVGAATDNQRLLAAGMMGYTIEAETTMRYWFNSAGSSWPEGFTESNVGILFDDSATWGTWFGPNPEYILGIQALPLWPNLAYLGHDAAHTEATLRKYFAARGQDVEEIDADAFADLEDSTPNDWQNVMLGYWTQADPGSATRIMGDLLEQDSPSMTKPDAGLYYFHAHALADIGRHDPGYHLSLPLGGVYTDGDRRTYVVTNTGDAATPVDVFDRNGNIVDTFDAEPGINVIRR